MENETRIDFASLARELNAIARGRGYEVRAVSKPDGIEFEDHEGNPLTRLVKGGEPVGRFAMDAENELIKLGTVNTERAWIRIERAGGNSVEVTEEEYWEALEVLPPIYLYERNSSAFAMSEAQSHDHNNDPVYFCFCKQADKYFGCLATLAEAQNKFKADLRRGK